MLERKLFGKIETLPEAVWWDFSKKIAPGRLGRTGLLNFVFRVQHTIRLSGGVFVAYSSLMAKFSSIGLMPPPRHLKRGRGAFLLPSKSPVEWLRLERTRQAPPHPQGYQLTILRSGIHVAYRETGGLHAACATLRQLLRTHGRRLPCLSIRDWPAFDRRGVMLDVSRGRVPKLETLMNLADILAGFKINEIQLYMEHTFAYRRHPAVWRGWGALTAREIKKLDRHCRDLGIDLVPNQNSFGHLRQFLARPEYRRLAEVNQCHEDASGTFVRHPSTLSPSHPGTLPFLRGLYDELLPCFSSRFFNVGADETWDLGLGQSRAACQKRGQGRVYLDFIRKLHREVASRKRHMMMWGDIILKHPDLIPLLPRPLTVLNWGYEANHPFDKETARFARAGIPFYVCPGTSTWQSMIGRHDNALANLKAAARAGAAKGATGYLVTDWGDGGHPQPLAVSWPMLVCGAALAWNPSGFRPGRVPAALARDVYHDPTGRLAAAAWGLGFSHRKLGMTAPNETPLGTVLAAPKPGSRELFCRNGPTWAAKIPPRHLAATLKDIQHCRKILHQSRPSTPDGRMLKRELDLVARMAMESIHYMLWQQALSAKKNTAARRLAKQGLQRLKELENETRRLWPLRNKGTPRHSTPFLAWRMEEYRKGRPMTPAIPRPKEKKRQP